MEGNCTGTGDGPRDVSPSAGSKPECGGGTLGRLSARAAQGGDRYRVEGEIGRGGMGVVFRVHDCELGRNLAMKVMLGQAAPSADHARASPPVDPQIVQRFLDEAQIAGQLEHPGVVPVYELGIDDQKRVYFTMRLVHGITAARVFEAAREATDGWTLTRALEVVLKVCDTMAFAHEKGVLHRDLKPDNVMVGRFGEVYVMDWGLAKVMGKPDPRDLRIRPATPTVSRVATDRSREEAGGDSPVMTMDGAVVGTPSYMSPEQAEGRVEVLDARADVYAVGAMLYQLLTGQQPYVRPGARVSPYSILAAVQAGPPTPIHTIDRTVPVELVAVCEMAMAREPERRYADMSALAEDLRAWLDKRVVKAYRTGPLVELAMWVRRNRGLALAAAAASVALVAGAIGTTAFAWRAETKAMEAEQERTKVGALSAAQREQLKAASWSAFHQADRLLARAREHSAVGNSPRAFVGEALLWLARAIEFDPANRVAVSRFSWEAGFWRGRCSAMSFASLVHSDIVNDAAFDATGGRVATACDDGTATIWDVASAKPMVSLPHDGPVERVAFSNDGKRIATTEMLRFEGSATARHGGSVRVFDAASGKRLARWSHPFVRAVSFDPAGRVLSWDFGRVQVRDAATGDLLVTIEPGGRTESARSSADGTRIVTAGSVDKNDLAGAGQVQVWDAETGERLLAMQTPRRSTRAEFGPDGSQLVVSGGDNEATLWSTVTGKQLRALRHADEVLDATFSPDGSRVATASRDGSVKLWNADTGELVHSHVHDGEVWRVDFSPDGMRMVSASWDDTARVWDVVSGGLLATLCHRTDVLGAAFGPSNDQVVTFGRDTVARVWSMDPIGPGVRVDPRGCLADAVFSSDGQRLATAPWYSKTPVDYATTVWDTDSGALLLTNAEPGTRHGVRGPASCVAFHPNEPRLLIAHEEGAVEVLDLAKGTVSLTCKTMGVSHVAWSPDGSRFATSAFAESGGNARVWNAASGREEVVLRSAQGFSSTSFRGDGTKLVTTSPFGATRIWNATNGQLETTLEGTDHDRLATHSPDGARVLVAGDATLPARIYDATTGKLLHRLGPAEHSTWSPDGARVITIDQGKARLWNAQTGEEVAFEPPLRAMPCDAISGDGTMTIGVVDGALVVTDIATGAMLVTLPHRGRFVRARFHAERPLAVAVCRQNTATTSASLDEGAWLWDLSLLCVPAASAEDAAAARAIAELLSGLSFDEQGVIGPLSIEREVEHWAALRAGTDRLGGLAPWVRWSSTRGADAPAMPSGAITRRQRADAMIRAGTIDPHAAYALDPTHPLVHIALAQDEADRVTLAAETGNRADRVSPVRQVFLRDYDLARLPADAGLWARAAEMLLFQQDMARARTAADKALSLDPTNETARRVAAEAK